MGDGARLRQILSNLLSNALKFTETGEVSLTVKRRKHGIAFLVRDSGIGISAEALPKLFGKFSQVDDSNTRRFGGTGLGLAISRELSQMMGGDIQVDSTPGVGSVFCVTLPLPRIGDRQAPKADAAPASHNGGLDRPVRILAAEDNPTNQKVLAALLSPLGVDLTIVADGQSAVDAWRGGGFDMVLMDIQMPVMSGVAAADAIRKLEATSLRRPTPIIALSANAMSHQIESYLKSGMTAHVAKPIEAGLLFAAIEAALEPQDEPAPARKHAAA
ncbi:MAG TPA: ATP-binding protein [Caulobacteraceae bacterium]|jgi:CheY-like chemotaxis protein